MDQNLDYSSMRPEVAIERKKKIVKESFEGLEKKLLEDGVLVTESREALLKLSIQELLKKLKDGQMKAVEALKAFQAKALEETKKTNCVTEFVAKAEIWAQERDETPLEQRGILHGLPISVKENFDVEGMETTLGLTKNLGKFADSNAVVVAALVNQGAVPFVKTNVPQIIYSAGCSNPIFGATTNPYDKSRSSGGSSGGEAALIVGGGSLLGVGSDMLGSVRIPAAFCGSFGIKPTQKRISREGSYGTYKSMIGIANTSGFLGKNTDALVLGIKAMLQDGYMSDLDPNVPHVPWKHLVYDANKPLRIGWFEGDEFLPVTPGCKRAINIAKNALEKRGHEVISFRPQGIADIFDFGLDIALSEGGSAMLSHWEGEIIDDAVKTNKKIMSAPSIIKTIMEKYLSIWSPIMAKMASQKASKSCDLWKAVTRQKNYVENLIKSWKSKEIDVLLGPAFPLPALHPSEIGNLMPACIYFGMYNIVDFPSGVLPVTVQTEEDERNLIDYPTHDYIFEIIKKETRDAVGLPIAVQVAALPWQEELVLRAMKEIELGIET